MAGVKTLAVLLLAVLTPLSACTSPSIDPSFTIRASVTKAGWQATSFDAPPFMLTGFSKPVKTQSPILHIYIEGDGNAYGPYGHVSTDPTPTTPIALNMAYTDPAVNVLYLARPCQYPLQEIKYICDQRYWTSHRFSEEVIKATNKAISVFKNKVGANKVILTGYSGGGAIAALVAAKRNDVTHLITVAGTLNHVLWMDYFKLPRLKNSLNPVDFADKLTKTPQTHFIGAKDKVVPRGIIGSYMATLKSKSGTEAPPAKIIEMPYYKHKCCWSKDWPSLLEKAGV
ncbi:MAG: alpha/beta hydrolase [Rhodospirillales bacterium]|nr:alpha/beta hydrolase [Rhodospirillales bacterium]